MEEQEKVMIGLEAAMGGWEWMVGWLNGCGQKRRWQTYTRNRLHLGWAPELLSGTSTGLALSNKTQAFFVDGDA